MTEEPAPNDPTPYECFSCGNIVRADSQPLTCPDCGGEMRNRRTRLE